MSRSCCLAAYKLMGAPQRLGVAVAAPRRAEVQRRLVAARRHLRLALARLARARLGLALAAHARRLVALAATRLREDAILLDFTGESLQRDFK